MANFALTSKAKIMILFANQYDMKDDSGNKVTGCSVHYLFWGENGEALASEAEFDPTKPVGVQRAKCSLDPMFRNKIVVAPGLYEGTFEMVTGSDGKPVNRLRDVAFISHVEIKQKVLPGRRQLRKPGSPERLLNNGRGCDRLPRGGFPFT